MYRKILIPIDSFEEDHEQRAAKAVRASLSLLTKDGGDVLAVSVLTPRGVGVSAQEFPQKLDQYRSRAKQILENVTASLLSFVKLRSVILPLGVESTLAAVKATLECATEENRDLIALSTHARRGVDRFFLGSFTETLLQHTNIPVLTLNPSCWWELPFTRILFPVDTVTLRGSQWFYASTLSKLLGLPVTLIHHQRPAVPLIALPGLATLPPVDLNFNEARLRMEGLRKQMSEAGVDTTLELVGERRSTPAVITEIAARHPSGLVLMLTHLGTKGRHGIGSTTRQVIRDSVCPVLSVPRGKSD